MSTYDPEQTGNYYVLGDSHAEMVQLIEADRYFTKAMGGLLPEQPEGVLLNLQDVLDVACGPGGWAMDLAKEFPDVQVSGLDISQGMIQYATVLARASKLDNAHFVVGSAIEPLPFPDNSFDLVNSRHIEGVIPTASWPVLLKEMVRVTRPGGIIRLTGNEWGIGNSAAFETHHALFIQGFIAVGLEHAPDARNYGIANMLSRYLRDAGCVNIQERTSFMDVSAGAELYPFWCKTWMVAVELAEPFFLSAGVSTKPEYERLKRQIGIEMAEDSFRGMVYTMTAWGQKPEGSKQ